MSLQSIKRDLRFIANKEKATILQRFFKTGKGQYGEGDIFIGVVVPNIRKVAKKNKDAELNDILTLLRSRVHEERLLALLIMIFKFSEGDIKQQEKIFKFYLKNIKHINNWDLVDLSSPNIIGAFLFDKDHELLYALARSKILWERRIAIISTFFFIKNLSFNTTLKISEMLINDKEDLIQKAVGWMLREIGKRDQKIEENFLLKHYKKMPRTMLRYAIERFDEKKRQRYLKGLI